MRLNYFPDLMKEDSLIISHSCYAEQQSEVFESYNKDLLTNWEVLLSEKFLSLYQ